jgi:hypothetical protein
LVNLVMPSEQNVEQLDDDEAFMENLKLRHVASNFDDLARNCSIGLMIFPYYQSYYPMQLAVRAMFRIDTNNRAHTNNRALEKTIMLLSNDIEKITTNQLFMYKVSPYVNKKPSRAIDLTDFTAVVM